MEKNTLFIMLNLCFGYLKKKKSLRFWYIAYGIVNSAFWGIYQMDSLWLLVTGDRRHVTGDIRHVTCDL